MTALTLTRRQQSVSSQQPKRLIWRPAPTTHELLERAAARIRALQFEVREVEQDIRDLESDIVFENHQKGQYIVRADAICQRLSLRQRAERSLLYFSSAWHASIVTEWRLFIASATPAQLCWAVDILEDEVWKTIPGGRA